jgi:hypothetical protein
VEAATGKPKQRQPSARAPWVTPERWALQPPVGGKAVPARSAALLDSAFAMNASSSKPAYVVLRQVGKDTWQVVREVNRQPGRTARAARAQAIQDATGGKAKAGEVYRAVLRSERRIAAE